MLIIGLFDGLQTLLGAIYAWPGGWLTDRWGQRRSLLLFNALSLAGYVLVLVWQHWLALVIGAFLFLAWSALSLPATFAVIATSLHQRQHTMGVGVQLHQRFRLRVQPGIALRNVEEPHLAHQQFPVMPPTPEILPRSGRTATFFEVPYCVPGTPVAGLSAAKPNITLPTIQAATAGSVGFRIRSTQPTVTSGDRSGSRYRIWQPMPEG